MKVSVAYVESRQQFWQEFDIQEGATALDAIERSGVLARHPHLDLARNKVGIYGRFVPLTARLTEGDRVEIYRPVTATDDDDDDD